MANITTFVPPQLADLLEQLRKNGRVVRRGALCLTTVSLARRSARFFYDLANAVPDNQLAQEFGDGTSNWQQDNLAEATCDSVVAQQQGQDDIDYHHAVLAYVWNNKPSNFAGRQGEWVDACAS